MSSRSTRVLVVDDEAAMREVLEMRLQEWGFDVCLAEDGVEGKELAESYNYADIDGFMKKARLQPVPPSESKDDTATYDDFLNEYQRLSKA